MTTSKMPLALALSGGGVRAIGFHLGVLRLLAERRMLESVVRVSTVSGGSLLVGLLLHHSAMVWPASEDFLGSVYPKIRSDLCTRSFQWGAARQLLRPWNWRFVLSRANLLAQTLKHEWRIAQTLSDLPLAPEWSINGTTAETGKRFRFKRDSVGEYTLGYAEPRGYPLADAIAVSAAFPGGFGPLTFDANRFAWMKRRSWEDPPDQQEAVGIEYRRLRLYDGGVYDNLGLEPLFDAGKLEAKHPGEAILVSDAGAPLSRGFSLFALNPWRFKRLSDIVMDQARALRVRTFTRYLQQSVQGGAYFYINTPVTPSTPCPSATFTAAFPTTLRRLTANEFKALSEHGYRVALQVEARYGLPV